jgi:hypothetical protein
MATSTLFILTFMLPTRTPPSTLCPPVLNWIPAAAINCHPSGTPECGTSGRCATYDAFGRMVEASVNSTWHTYWYTQAGKIVMTGTTILTGRWPTSSGTAETIGTSCCTYLHSDWLGNSRIVSSINNNTVSADQAYTPYGEIYNIFGANNGQYQVFAGTIADLGPSTTTPTMWDTPNRELSYAGRWLSPDPAGSGWNQYAYAGSNPLSNADPLGLCDDTDLSDCPDAPTPQCGGPGQLACGGAPTPYIVAGSLIWTGSGSGPNTYSFEFAQADAQAAVNATNFTLFYNGAGGAIGGIGSSPAANNTAWQWIKNTAQEIGSYIPVACGAGVFAYGGVNAGSPASLTVAKWGQADTMGGTSSGLFTELSGGEGLVGGVGGQATPGQPMEYYLFGGVGEKAPGFISGNASEFVSSDFQSLSYSIGGALEGSIGRSAGGVGAYIDYTSITSCLSKH